MLCTQRRRKPLQIQALRGIEGGHEEIPYRKEVEILLQERLQMADEEQQEQLDSEKISEQYGVESKK